MKKKSWIIKLRCVVTKEVITSECTEEEARINTFRYASNEMETDMLDWKVLSVEPNE